MKMEITRPAFRLTMSPSYKLPAIKESSRSRGLSFMAELQNRSEFGALKP